uniref:hypothetical protein n=1 Tax=Yoonia sp. TaxID=2212373 RepID=UPI0040473AF3
MAMKFDSTVSLGNLLSIVTVVVGLSIGYATIKAEQTTLIRDIEVMKSNGSAREGRLRAVEIQQASQSSDLRSIQVGITEIKELIGKLRE